MANLAEALKSSISTEEPAADPIAPVETPDIADEFEEEASSGDEKPKPEGKETDEKPEPGKKPPDQVPWKALKAERDKRQEAQAKVAYLQGKLDGQPDPKADDGPSDEDLDNEFLLSPSATLEARVESKIETVMRDERANTSDAMMRMTKEDYPELLEEFAGLANANPELWQRARQEAVPALAIYNFMKARKNPPPKDEKKLREEIRAEIEEENKKKAALEDAEDTPPSPAGAPGSGEAPDEKFKTIDDLFAKRRRAVGW